ncbi:MAG: ankyrin repeat domain-containing protein, partial [archaeon]|nr:ankyrin repeat domain-containing protein [archaeon]
MARSDTLNEKQFQTIVTTALGVGANLSLSNLGGLSAIHELAMLGLTNRLDFLISKGVPINLKSEISDTPLHFATRTRQFATIDYLLKHGALVNMPGTDGTPLDMAQKMQFPAEILQSMQSQFLKEADHGPGLQRERSVAKLSSKEHAILSSRAPISSTATSLSSFSQSLLLDPRFADVVFLFDNHEPLYAHYPMLQLRARKLASVASPLKYLKKNKVNYAQVSVDMSNPRINALLQTSSTPISTVGFEDINAMLHDSFWVLPFPNDREFAPLRPGQPLSINSLKIALAFVYSANIPSETLKAFSLVEVASVYDTSIRCELDQMRLL